MLLKVPEQASESAFVLGPTGVALGGDGTLYVASARDNSIASIPGADLRTTDAGTGFGISARGELAAPLGLAMAPNGDILAVNRDQREDRRGQAGWPASGHRDAGQPRQAGRGGSAVWPGLGPR